jgi:DNA-binding response OmpR family regulator
MVIEARDARRAREELRVRSLDVLIVEVGSGSGDGFRLAQHARRLQPRLHVIYMSDWSLKERPVSGAVFLERPVRLAALDEALRWLHVATV